MSRFCPPALAALLLLSASPAAAASAPPADAPVAAPAPFQPRVSDPMLAPMAPATRAVARWDEALRLLRERWPDLPSLAAAEPEQVLEAKLPDPLDRRALHVSRETRRVREAVSLLRAGKPLTRELLVGSHESLRDLYECSRAELDWFVERVLRERGVRGARLTGAGWGGCAIAIGDEEAMMAAAPGIAREYEARFRLTPRSWMTRAAAGARVEAAN